MTKLRTAVIASSLIASLAAFPVLHGGVRGKSQDPLQEFVTRTEKLGDRNPKGWLDLATYCEAHRLWDQRDEALRKVVALAPNNAEAHARLDEVKVAKEWLPVEEAEAQEAKAQEAKGRVFYGNAWILANEAERLLQADRKQVGWPCQRRIETSRLILYSGKPLDFTRHVAAVLENEMKAYEEFHGKFLKLAPRKMKVYLFSDHASFLEKYNADTQDTTNSAKRIAGVYDAGHDILYVGGHPDGFVPAQYLSCALHEMLHGMDHRFAELPLSAPPHWVWEGRAEYFAYSARGRQVFPGAFHMHPACDRLPAHLERTMGSLTLTQLLTVEDYARFGPEHQLLAWAFVHFLYHGEDGKYTDRFNAYLTGIAKRSDLKSFEAGVGKLSELEPAFRRYVDDVFAPALKAACPAP